jgi:hypothetical protein
MGGKRQTANGKRKNGRLCGDLIPVAVFIGLTWIVLA